MVHLRGERQQFWPIGLLELVFDARDDGAHLLRLNVQPDQSGDAS